VTTNEGGSIEEEVYVRNVVDQVDTFGTVMLGLTTGCARCHDHKFDPVTMKDYYGLFAFFNSIDGKPMDGNAAQHPPVVRVGSPDQVAALDKFQKQAAEVRRKVNAEVAKVQLDESDTADRPALPKRAEYVWIDDAVPPGAKLEVHGEDWRWTYRPE